VFSGPCRLAGGDYTFSSADVEMKYSLNKTMSLMEKALQGTTGISIGRFTPVSWGGFAVKFYCKPIRENLEELKRRKYGSENWIEEMIARDERKCVD